MSKPALIVVDMQLRFEDKSRAMNIIEKVVSVIQACHKQGIPVFFTQHNDPDPNSILRKWWDPIIKDTDEWKLIHDIEAVADRNEDTFIEDKTTYDAFHGTSLKKYLLDRGVDTVVVCGAMTNLCCETTARTAFVNNFNVIFLRDGNAMSTQEFHDITIKNLEFGFATIKTCEEFIATLECHINFTKSAKIMVYKHVVTSYNQIYKCKVKVIFILVVFTWCLVFLVVLGNKLLLVLLS